MNAVNVANECSWRHIYLNGDNVRYKISIPGALNVFLKESNCNSKILQVEVKIGERMFLGYLELCDNR